MPIVNLLEEMEWEDAPKGYYITDVKRKVLWVDEESGATWALIKFPPGIGDKLHTHPQANQLTFGLSGEMKRPDGTLMQANGTSATIFPKGEVHGRGNFTKESLLLMYWDGPPDPEVAE
jgi:quercetin dioxygenase-like cupin family protein